MIKKKKNKSSLRYKNIFGYQVNHDVHRILGYYSVKTNWWEYEYNAANRQGPKRLRNGLQAPLR